MLRNLKHSKAYDQLQRRSITKDGPLTWKKYTGIIRSCRIEAYHKLTAEGSINFDRFTEPGNWHIYFDPPPFEFKREYINLPTLEAQCLLTLLEQRLKIPITPSD